MCSYHPQLTSAGYPINPRSIFIGVRRENLPSREELEKAWDINYPEFTLTVRHLGVWERLVGWITQVTRFPDGIVLHFSQNLSKSPLKWPNAILWVPNKGSAGILS
jgi:hypothetical protein